MYRVSKKAGTRVLGIKVSQSTGLVEAASGAVVSSAFI
jgi:hypothetical protein